MRTPQHPITPGPGFAGRLPAWPRALLLVAGVLVFSVAGAGTALAGVPAWSISSIATPTNFTRANGEVCNPEESKPCDL